MSQPQDSISLELHLFSSSESEMHVELLTAITHYHRTGKAIGLHDTVNFGREWVPGSQCEHGLISLPYLDGPALEWLRIKKTGTSVRFLWLVPITREELTLAKSQGVEALERVFETKSLNYADPMRASVVPATAETENIE
jgi:hypothetical protein